MESQTVQPSLTTSNVVPSEQDQVSLKGKWWRRLFKMNKKDWLEDMRGNLSMVATLVAAITFQVALNPPGGVVQTSTETNNTKVDCSASTLDKTIQICTGEAVLAIIYQHDYLIFLLFNTFSFVGSLSAALLLVSGIPLRNRPLMWFLSIAMSTSLTFLAITYLNGVLLVTPDPIYDEARKIFKIVMKIWIILLMLVILFNTICFLAWCVNKCRKLFNRVTNNRNSSVNQEINEA